MKRYLSLLTLALALCCLIFPASAQGQNQSKAEPTLKVGDDAPALSLKHWWQDKTLPKLAKGNVYIIDFWASWCPPCRESFPFLAQLKQQYGDQDVEVIAVSIDDRIADAAQFLGQQGQGFDFYVGWDSTAEAWRDWGTAAGRNSIPSAFIVDRAGKIAYIGHPMSAEKPLKQLLAEQAPEIKVVD